MVIWLKPQIPTFHHAKSGLNQKTRLILPTKMWKQQPWDLDVSWTQHVRDITNLEGRCQPHGQFLVVVQQKFTKRSFLRICPSQLIPRFLTIFPCDSCLGKPSNPQDLARQITISLLRKRFFGFIMFHRLICPSSEVIHITWVSEHTLTWTNYRYT